jgi:hypothetical protein
LTRRPKVPICPSCRDEFDEGVRFCADCEVELVASAADIPAAEEREDHEEEFEGELRWLVESRVLAERMREVLLARHLPCYLYRRTVQFEGRETSILAIPAEFRERAETLLRPWPYEDIAGPGGELRLYVSGVEEAEEEPPVDVLRLTDDEILARGASVHSELVDAVFRGSPAHAARGVDLLARMGDEGRRLLVEILLEASAAKKRNFVSAFLFFVRPYRLIPPKEGLDALAAAPDPEVRRLGVEITGRLLGREGAPALVRMLEDESEEVRDEAIEALFRIFSQDFGFDPAGPERERAAAVERWRRHVARG